MVLFTTRSMYLNVSHSGLWYTSISSSILTETLKPADNMRHHHYVESVNYIKHLQ